MDKFKLATAVLTAVLLFSCSSQQIGLKENWIDERDVMALRDMPLDAWVEKSGRPTLVEIVGDTSLYYYNYRPTLYAVAIYDSTTFFKTWGTASESKPGAENAAEVWGSRKDVMLIKVVGGSLVSATISYGPDRKVLVRDLNGDIIIDPNSGYNSNVSEEQKINNSSKDYNKVFSSLYGKPAIDSVSASPSPADSATAPKTDSAAVHAPVVPAAHVPAAPAVPVAPPKADSTAAHVPAAPAVPIAHPKADSAAAHAPATPAAPAPAAK
jgi:hypothetical protein